MNCLALTQQEQISCPVCGEGLSHRIIPMIPCLNMREDTGLFLQLILPRQHSVTYAAGKIEPRLPTHLVCQQII